MVVAEEEEKESRDVSNKKVVCPAGYKVTKDLGSPHLQIRSWLPTSLSMPAVLGGLMVSTTGKQHYEPGTGGLLNSHQHHRGDPLLTYIA